MNTSVSFCGYKFSLSLLLFWRLGGNSLPKIPIYLFNSSTKRDQLQLLWSEPNPFERGINPVESCSNQFCV